MTSGPLGLPEKVLSLHDALTAAGIDHAFGGALALAYYTTDPRTTQDIDVNVSADPDEPQHVLAALPDGIVRSDADRTRIRRDGQVRLWWGERPGATPVDLFFPQHELHAAVAAGRQLQPFAGRQLPFLSATHLTIFKSLFARPKDWLDVEAMLRAGTVDVGEVRRWLELLVGPDDDRHLAPFLAVAALAHTPEPAPPPFRQLLRRAQDSS